MKTLILFVVIATILFFAFADYLRRKFTWRRHLDIPAGANTWPPTSGTTTGFTASKTTVQWGTDGLLQSPKPASGFYVVTRFSQKQLVDVTRLPNGTGITSNRVVLVDGVQFEITVRDDSAMTPPVANSTIVVTDAAGMLGTVGNVYTCKVLDNSYDAAPKQPGERVILAENLVLIDSQTPGSPV